jgi:hypothetical protein
MTPDPVPDSDVSLGTSDCLCYHDALAQATTAGWEEVHWNVHEAAVPEIDVCDPL